MADALAEALNSLEEDSILNKSSGGNFLPEEKPSDNAQYSLEASQKSGFDFEVNLQPERILEVITLPDGSRSYRMKWKDTWIHEGLMPAYQHLVDEFWKEESQKRKKQQVSQQENNELQFPEKDTSESASQQPDEKPEERDQSTVPPENDINMILMDRSDNTQQKGAASAKDQNNDLETPESDTVKSNENVVGTENETNYKIGKKRKSSKQLRRKGKKSKKAGKATVKTAKEEKENQDKQQNENEEETQEKDRADIDEENVAGDDDRYIYPDDKGPCTCNICGKVISNKYGLREHQTVVHFKNGKFACDICGKRVTNKRALNLHMTSHSSERKYVCEMCGSSHKTKGNLNYHVKTMHTMIKNFRCDICFKTFKVQAELKEHCFSVHSNEGVITCIVCKKKLTTALSIYTHSVMHSGAREHECGQCGYAFKTATGLKEHMVTHSEDKPVRQCPHCERKFFSRSQYNAHVMRHTADGSLITYKCPNCDVKFQHKSSYNRHVIRHQPGGDLEYPKQNPYLLLDESELPEGVCHKCRKHYSSKSGFYLHLKKCRDGIVQQFQCPYCERGCSNRSSLKRHIQRRHMGMEYEGQTVRGHEVPADEVDENNAAHQTAVLTQDGIQYHQNAYFDHGYGNQITTVDASQLATVDVQLLIDTAAAQDGQTAAQILSNVGQVAQLTQNGDTTQNLHIVSENDVAQLAAHLSQHGVIVRSSGNVSNDHNQGQHLIVSSAQIDARTGQLLMSESQAAQIIADAEALQNRNQIQNEGTITLQSPADQNNLLSQENVLHFGNRTAVIQIQHTGGEGLTGQQVLTIPEEQVAQLTAQPIQTSGVHVTELQHSNDIGEIEQENSNSVQHFIQEEQIVSSMNAAASGATDENDVEHPYQSIDI